MKLRFVQVDYVSIQRCERLEELQQKIRRIDCKYKDRICIYSCKSKSKISKDNELSNEKQLLILTAQEQQKYIPHIMDHILIYFVNPTYNITIKIQTFKYSTVRQLKIYSIPKITIHSNKIFKVLSKTLFLPQNQILLNLPISNTSIFYLIQTQQQIPIQIYLQAIHGPSYKLSLSNPNTILDDIRNQTLRLFHIPYEQQNLIYLGIKLNDENIKLYSIQNKSRIYIHSYNILKRQIYMGERGELQQMIQDHEILQNAKKVKSIEDKEQKKQENFVIEQEQIVEDNNKNINIKDQ